MFPCHNRIKTNVQMLADSVNMPCRVVKGCKYCKRDDASSCLVRFGHERFVLVHLVINIISYLWCRAKLRAVLHSY